MVVRGAAISIAVAAVTLGVIELSFSVDLRCIRPFVFTEPASAATSALIFGMWVALLLWVWGRGGEFIAKAPSVFMTLARPETEYEPSTVRLVITALVVVGGVGAFVASSGTPPSLGCAG